MNRKRRDTKGKFTNNIDCLPEELKESQITKENGLNWNIFLKIIIILVLVIFSSPWMFIFSRNASIHNFAGRIGEFFSDSFSCERENLISNTSRRILNMTGF